MNNHLLLTHIRGALIRLEETIIFSLLERAQFKRNRAAYDSGALGDMFGAESLVEYMLHETEKIHAGMRRYTSPDEHPFFSDLPEPLLQPLRYHENPLVKNTVNLNHELLRAYTDILIPALCAEGDDAQYGSTAVCDVACLQALSKRIHYGKFVAESKYQAEPERYTTLIAAGDRHGLADAITDDAVEEALFQRVAKKAGSYSGMFLDPQSAKNFQTTVTAIYRDIIIPLTKRVEVDYLLTGKR
ncbi:MAG: chorismate mutase [Lentisphaeria bacterium]|nr:chorismate mutase [Lentisphaeria bacterium]